MTVIKIQSLVPNGQLEHRGDANPGSAKPLWQGGSNNEGSSYDG
ncbi:MAG: hypothetical protein AAFY20_16505 [Cyanobacteria bacterium J06639_14]